jgi:hypothetical protein
MKTESNLFSSCAKDNDSITISVLSIKRDICKVPQTWEKYHNYQDNLMDSSTKRTNHPKLTHKGTCWSLISGIKAQHTVELPNQGERPSLYQLKPVCAEITASLVI